MPARTRLTPLFLAPFLLGAALGFTFRNASVLAAEVSAEDRKQAQEAVKALASDSFSERFNAKNQLLQLGRASVEPLENATKSEDAEVRLRSLEILIALRGRGFLGIGLQESTDEEVVDLDEAPDEAGKGAAKTVAPPVVIANQIVNYKQAPYNTYGVNKPFPAEAAGMQPGDRILSINDRPIHGTKDLMREVITIGPARTAIVVVERGEQRMRLPVLLTRNPIMMRGNEFGGYQYVRDNTPPVDLEREADGAEPDKRADAAAPRPAQGGVQIIGGGQVFIQGGVKVFVQQIGAQGPNAVQPKVEIQVQVDGGEVKKINLDRPKQN
jgi:membrane-associated protease RseP (regulator of RpoE activity)